VTHEPGAPGPDQPGPETPPAPAWANLPGPAGEPVVPDDPAAPVPAASGPAPVDTPPEPPAPAETPPPEASAEQTPAAATAPEQPAPEQPAPERPAPERPAPEEPPAAPVEGGRAARRRAAEAAAAAAAGGAGSVPFVELPDEPEAGSDGAADASPVSEGGRAARRRAAEEAARDSAVVSRRRALMLSGAVLGALVLLGVVLGGWTLLHRTPTVSPTADPTPTPTSTEPTQPTLLIQVKTPDGLAVDNNLTSVGGSVQTANMIGMPSTLMLDPATGGTQTIAEVGRLPDINATGDALSDATGINVDGTWAMDTLAFSGLVDAVGGVVVDVDANVYVTQPDGKEVILVAAGEKKLLEGPQAAAYATYLAPGEDAIARMPRYQKVLAATLAKLPSDSSKIEAIITALGASAKSSVPSAQLSSYLAKLRELLVDADMHYQPLPTEEISGSSPTAYRVDQAQTTTMINQYLPDAKRKAGPNSQVRVYVQNGVGTPGLNAKARQLLVDAGFSYVNGGNAEGFGQATTLILIPDDTVQSKKWGTDIATALKVPASDIAVSSDHQSIGDVAVVLGADFTPAA
jgi:anionic cell wall polymer biosynthesis LytR-Cps2A-Psr (LCP) family protein